MEIALLTLRSDTLVRKRNSYEHLVLRFSCRRCHRNVFTLATLPICNRSAIQRTGSSVAFLNRMAISILCGSPLVLFPNVSSGHRRRRHF